MLDRIARAKRVTWALLSQHAHVADFDGETLVLGTSSPGLAQAVERAPHPGVVAAALFDALGIRARVTARPDSGAPAPTLPTEPDRSGPPAQPRPAQPRPDQPRPDQPRPDQPRPDQPRMTASSPTDGDLPPSLAEEAVTRQSSDGPGGPSNAAATATEPPVARRSRAAEALARAGLASGAATDGGGGWGSVNAPPPEWAAAETPAALAKSDAPKPKPEEEITESMDDEDVDDPGEVGLPVMQAVLGATVIDEQVD